MICSTSYRSPFYAVQSADIESVVKKKKKKAEKRKCHCLTSPEEPMAGWKSSSKVIASSQCATCLYSLLLVFLLPCGTSLLLYQKPVMSEEVGTDLLSSRSPVSEDILLPNRVGRHSSVGISTRYGLDGLGIESQWRQGYPCPS